MAKYVQPTFDVYGVAGFKNNTTFDASVYLKGTTRISNPVGTTGTPFALVVDSLGNDIQVKSIQLGTMATETASNYYTSTQTDSAIATAVDDVDSSLVTYIGTQTAFVDTSLNDLWLDQASQDTFIAANTVKWEDSNRNGLLNQTETTLAFVDTTGVFTLGDSGSGWSYYLNGQKYTFSGATTITLPGGGSAAADRYYIYIDNNTDASLAVSTGVWDREAGQLPVAFIDFDASNAFSKYWMGEERHTMLIDTRMHKYLHNTRGTQFISGGTLDGPVVAGPGGIGATDASNAFGVAATTIADEDIYQTLIDLAKPADPTGTPGTYNVFSRTAPTVWTWISEDTPLPEAGSYIQYDNGTNLSTATAGQYVNSYLIFTNLNGKARYSIIPGQGAFGTLAGAIDENFAAFDLSGLPIAEYVAAWQFTWEASAGLATRGKVSLASTPVRIQVNSATASTPTTEAHNDLLGLQGGSATQRYHLDLAQYNDYIGKTDVDSSLLTVWTQFGYVNSSLNGLDGRVTTNEGDITNVESSLGTLNGLINTNITDITNIESSLGTLNGLINTNTGDITNIESSLGTLNGLINTNITDITNIESSLGTLNTWNINQDISISNISSAQGNYVLKTGDTMSGPLTITSGGLSVSNDVSISGGLLVSGNDGLIVSNDAFIGGSLTIDGSLYVTNVETIDVSAAFIHLNTGLTGTPPPTMQSGMVIGRGSAEPYVFLFDETLDSFRIGVATETSTGYLDASTQAVATREDAPNSAAIPFWNATDFRFETVNDFTFNATSGLSIADRITAGGGITANSLDASTQTYALMVPATGGGVVSTRQLGSNAFTSDSYVLQSLFDTSITAIWSQFGNVDTSLNGLDGRVTTNEGDITNIESSLGTLNGLINTNITNISTNTAQIAQLDASIIRIDASLNDVIDILDLGFVTEASIATFKTDYIDPSLNAKYDKTGGTLTGLVTFASQGFTLDSITITNIDTSAEGLGVGLDTHIPTSAAVKSLVDSAISAGVTASNGLYESGGDIRLGGALTEDTSIDVAGNAFKFIGLDNISGELTVYVESSLGALSTETLGTMSLETAANYYTSIQTDSAIATAVGNVDSSLVTYTDTTIATAVGNVDSSLVTYTDTTIATAVGNVDSSLVTYTDGAIATAVGNVDTSLVTYTNTAVGNVDTSIVTWADGKFVELAGDTMSGALTISAGGLSVANDVSVGSLNLDGARITTIDTSAEGISQLDTAIPTSAAVKSLVDSAISAGVTASNGLHEVAGDIRLGGALTEDTSIDTTGQTISFRGLQTSLIDTPLALVQDSADSSLLVRQLGSMAWYTESNYYTTTEADAAIATAVGNVDTSLVTYTDGAIATAVGNVDTSLVTYTNTAIGNVDTSLVTYTNTAIGNVDTSLVTYTDGAIATAVGNVDTSIVTWADGKFVELAGDTMTGPLTISGGGLSVANDVSISGGLLVSGSGGLIVSNDAFIGGSLTIDGSLFVTNVETIDVSAAFIHLNTGLTGTPPATMQSGLVVGRGSEDPYVFLFDETLDTFRIGAAVETSTGYLDVDTQAVATREDTPESWGVGYWNGTDFQIETSAGFTFQPGVGLSLPITTDQGTEKTVLSIVAGLVGSVELGTMAFATAADFALAADLSDVSTRVNNNESSIGTLNGLIQTNITDITNIESSLGTLNTWNVNQDSSLGTLNGLINTNIANIDFVETSLGTLNGLINTNIANIDFVETSLGTLNGLINTNTTSITSLNQSITDLSTGKISGVANINVVGDASLYSYTDATHIAQLKKIVAGSGATITEDVSTITIAVSGAAGYVSKYTGTFTADGSTSMSVLESTHNLGVGPLSVAVYEGTDQVYVGVDNAGNGDITLTWIAASLAGTCKFIITG